MRFLLLIFTIWMAYLRCWKPQRKSRPPIIVEIYHVYYPFLHQKVICSAVQETLRSARIHAYLHLDHATDQQVLMAAIKDGFQSVMVDGSTASLEENIAFTKQITTIAKENGVIQRLRSDMLPGRHGELRGESRYCG